jgi:putative zinc finger/helix-turn-helix YgiT family protein
MRCLKEEVYPETIPYTAEVKHDGRLHRVEVPALTIPKCRACGALTFTNSADDQVLQALRALLRLLTPQQIRAGRKKLGLKAKELAERLGVAAGTVSRWEKEHLIQSRAMDNYLRVYFALPEVRAVLQGAGQDPNLGTEGARRPDRAQADRPAPAVNRIQSRFRRLRDIEAKCRQAQLFQVEPGVS